MEKTKWIENKWRGPDGEDQMEWTKLRGPNGGEPMRDPPSATLQPVLSMCSIHHTTMEPLLTTTPEKRPLSL